MILSNIYKKGHQELNNNNNQWATFSLRARNQFHLCTSAHLFNVAQFACTYIEGATHAPSSAHESSRLTAPLAQPATRPPGTGNKCRKIRRSGEFSSAGSSHRRVGASLVRGHTFAICNLQSPSRPESSQARPLNHLHATLMDQPARWPGIEATSSAESAAPG